MKYRLLMAYQDCISTFGPLLEDVLIEVKDLIGVGYDNLRARFQYVYYKFQKKIMEQTNQTKVIYDERQDTALSPGEELVPMLNVRSFGRELQKARRVFEDVRNELTTGQSSIYRLVRFVLPVSRRSLVDRLEYHKSIVQKESGHLKKAISTFRRKLDYISEWQDADDDRIVELSEADERTIARLEQCYIDLKKVKDASNVLYARETVPLRDRSLLRKTLRSLEGEVHELKYSHLEQLTNLGLANDEIDKLQLFKVPLRIFYYCARNLDNGLNKLVSHTNKGLILLRDIGPELAVVSKYIQQGENLWENAIQYLSGLEQGYKHLEGYTQTELEMQSSGKVSSEDKTVINGIKLAQNILTDNGEDE